MRTRKYAAGIGAAFALAMAAVCASSSVLAQNHQAQPAAASAALSSAREVIPFVMYKLEGPGYVADDNHKGPSRFGVLGATHGLSPSQVRNLSPSEAFRILKRDEWNAIGADNLAANMRLPAFSLAMEFGPPRAVNMIADAHGDPDRLLQEGASLEARLAVRHPETDGRCLKGWERRRKILTAYVDHGQRFSRFKAPQAATFARFDHGSPGPQAFVDDSPQARPAFSPPSHFKAAGFSHAVSIPRQGSRPWWTVWAALIVAPFLWAAGNSKQRLSRQPEMVESVPMLGSKEGDGAFGQSPQDQAFSNSSFSSDGSSAGASSSFDFPDMTDAEYAAFYKHFWHHEPIRHDDGHAWKVNYENGCHVLVSRGHVTMHGDGGIEDSLKFAAEAWGNNCVMTGGTDEFREKIRVAAQKLVDEGAIASGFSIEGIGIFRATTEPKTASRPRPQATFSAVRGAAFA